MTETEGSRDK